ncbi:AraC family transcriptional regulator [Enterococcus casseliflavus]|uniref:AraC family transcriptional regulator n=1 Tax=Enterococcus casseliflavus TaxID=37734 RepID=UPI002FBF08E9
MDNQLKRLLKPLIKTRAWKDVQNRLKPDLYAKMNNQNIYKFYSTLTDSLGSNPNSIAVWVHSIDSYAPLHVHDYVEITIPLIGSCTIKTKKEEIVINEKNIFITGDHAVHTVKPVPKNSLVVCIGLKDSAFTLNDYKELLKIHSQKAIPSLLLSSFSQENDHGENYMLFNTNNNPKINTNVENIIWEYYNPDSQSNQIIHHELLILFSRLVRLTSEQNLHFSSQNSSSVNILTLLLYIEKNYSDISLTTMSKAFGLNPNYLSNFMKRHTGMTFIQLVHLQRINTAAEYLTYTNATVDKIAEKVGYEDPSYFYRIFRKFLGLSPKAYREKKQSKEIFI